MNYYLILRARSLEAYVQSEDSGFNVMVLADKRARESYQLVDLSTFRKNEAFLPKINSF